jgi:hypothetical protein
MAGAIMAGACTSQSARNAATADEYGTELVACVDQNTTRDAAVACQCASAAKWHRAPMHYCPTKDGGL